MAIKALEQQKNEWQAGYDMAWEEAEVVFEKEPLEECEDVISRKEVLDLCDSDDPEYKISHLKEDVECLPSVQPQQRTGEWISAGMGFSPYKCSECDFTEINVFTKDKFHYCPNCGAKMQ